MGLGKTSASPPLPARWADPDSRLKSSRSSKLCLAVPTPFPQKRRWPQLKNIVCIYKKMPHLPTGIFLLRFNISNSGLLFFLVLNDSITGKCRDLGFVCSFLGRSLGRFRLGGSRFFRLNLRQLFLSTLLFPNLVVAV
jgi:hypothetical protein